MAGQRWKNWWQVPLPRWAEVALLLFVLAVAAAFRLYQIGKEPPGPHYDEAAAGLDALDVLAGRHTIFSPRSYGREMLFVYVAAPFIASLGATQLALRLPIALVGILTVLVTYLLAKELFEDEDKQQAKWTAILAALFLSLSFWHLVLNHISFRANYLPLTGTLCFLFLWRGVRTKSLRSYVASGFFLGVSLHTYTSARFLPLVLAVFFAALLPSRKGREMVLPRWRHWILVASVALLVAAPLIAFFFAHPDSSFLRVKGVSILNAQLHQGNIWGLLRRSILGNLGLFGLRGDPNWLYNIPGRPGLNPIQAVLFWLGISLCLFRWRRPRYLFLPIWWFVMLLPSILAPDPIPHSLRAIGSLPPAMILSALALTELARLLVRRFRRVQASITLSLAILAITYLACAGYDTWHSYFDVWLPREEVYYAYHGHMADLARQINHDTDPDAVYIFPVNYDRRGEAYHEYTLELLHQGPVPFRYVIVDDATVTTDLTDICAGKRQVHLIVWTHGEHVDADPRNVLPFFLEGTGLQIEVRAYRGYRIVSYELSSETPVFDLPGFAPAEVNLGNELKLVSYAHAGDAPSGRDVCIALDWQVEQEIRGDYKASLRLLDPQGHVVGQSDTALLSNEHQPASQWVPGQKVITYHLLPSLPATMPGTYQVELVVYDPKTSTQLEILDLEGAPRGQRVDLCKLEIRRPERQPVVEPETPLEDSGLAPGLILTGYDLDREGFSPGETIHLALYWRLRDETPHDYVMIFQLVDELGEVAAKWMEVPAYPTSQWQADDLWRDWHALRIARNMPTGTYQLKMHLAEVQPLSEVLLGHIRVEGRVRQFKVPEISHPRVGQFGEAIRFLGFDLAVERPRAGEALHLILYWQSVAETDVSYTVFIHLLDGDSRIWGQQDSVPGGGTMPMSSWVSGEVIVDEYEIPANADTPAGEYLLEIGVYQAETGERLPIFDLAGQPLGDHLLLDTPLTVVR